MSTAPNVQRRKMQLICKASATELSCSVNRPEYSGYRSKGRLCARAAISGRRAASLLWREPAGPGRPRGGTSPCRFVLSRPPAPGATRCASPRLSAKPALRLWAGHSHQKFPGGGPRPPAILPPCSPAPARPPRQGRQGVRLPGFLQNRPCAFGPGILTKNSREGDHGPPRYCPRVAQLPRHTAPARSVPLRPAPRSRPCAARAQQKRTAEKFRRPFERALSASQKLSTGCRASDSWCAAGDAPFRCPACPDTPCRAG